MAKLTSQQLKERILLLTYIYRSLPTIYLKTVAATIEEKEKIREITNNLLRFGYIAAKISKPLNFTFIHVTKKRYDYLLSSLFKGVEKPIYQYKESRSLLKPILNHSFLNFAYLWHFHKNYKGNINPNTQMYEDSDINNCNILFQYKGKDVLISPDVIIYIPETNGTLQKQAIFVENDTGRETYKTIFHKIIDYIALAEEGRDKHKLSTIAVYFVFLSDRRRKQLFSLNKGFLRYFNAYNKTSRGLEIRIKNIIKTLTNVPITFYISTYDSTIPQKPYSFKKYNVLSSLLEKEASWNIFR